MNTQQKHTAEPWVFGVCWNYNQKREVLGIKKSSEAHVDKSRLVCTVSGMENVDAEDYANAQRIVECVNACAGLTSEQLANIHELGATLQNRTLQIEDLRKDLARRDAEIQSYREPLNTIREFLKTDPDTNTHTDVIEKFSEQTDTLLKMQEERATQEKVLTLMNDEIRNLRELLEDTRAAREKYKEELLLSDKRTNDAQQMLRETREYLAASNNTKQILQM